MRTQSLVTPWSPVTIGETLTPPRTLGTLDTSGNASGITAYIDRISATVSSGGAQSPARRVYLVNLTVSSGVRSLDVYLDISGPGAYNSSVLILVGSGRTGADSAIPLSVRRLETKKRFPRVWRKP